MLCDEINDDLYEVIKKYQNSVAELFPKVAKHLQVKLPISNVDWSAIGVKQIGETSCGIKYFIHGYGIAMNNGNLSVDFDIGDNGEIDGVDSWKLAEFIRKNNIKSSFNDGKNIELAMKEAVSSGHMIYSGYLLYYLS